jgi:hypothetical protein
MEGEKEKLSKDFNFQKENSSFDLEQKNSLDIEADRFFKEFERDIEELERVDAFLQFILKKGLVSLDETISSAIEKINQRMEELEETKNVLKRGKIKKKNFDQDDIDREFEELITNERSEIEEELENLGNLYRIIGYLLRSKEISESDLLIKFQETIFNLIKKLKLS